MDQIQLLNNDDVDYIINLIGKTINVTTIDNKLFTGSVYVIDPQTKIIVLFNNENLCAILPHAIKHVEVVPEPEQQQQPYDNLDNFLPNDKWAMGNQQQIFIKKINAKMWLEKHLVRVKEDGMLLNVEHQVFIEPPYGPEQCLGKNASILGRIKEIMSTMPY